MNASERALLSALVDHSVAPRILDIHLDDCDDDACTGCEPLYRQARAERNLAEHAAEAGMTPDAYRVRGLDLEWHHEVDYPAVPYSPYLQLGEAS